MALGAIITPGYVLKLQMEEKLNEVASSIKSSTGLLRRASFVFDTMNYKSYEQIPVVSVIRHRSVFNKLCVLGFVP